MNGDYKSHPHNPGAGQQQIRQAHVFPGFSPYPTHPGASIPSVAPQMHDGIDNHHLPPHPTTTIPASSSTHANSVNHLSAGANPSSNTSSPEKKPSSSLFPEIEPRKRKFILVEDTERNNRVRVKVNLDAVDIAEIPDSYRDANSVYPRAYFPAQMQLSPRSNVARRHRGRFSVGDDDRRTGGFETRCSVKVPGLETDEIGVPMPRLGHAVERKEEKLNDLGYRMSWSQSRVFAGRVIFLQRSRGFPFLSHVWDRAMLGTFR